MRKLATFFSLALIVTSLSSCRATDSPAYWGCIDKTGILVREPKVVIGEPNCDIYSGSPMVARDRVEDEPRLNEDFLPGTYLLNKDDQYVIVVHSMPPNEQAQLGIDSKIWIKKIGIADRKGNLYITPEYNEVSYASKSIVRLSKLSGDKYGGIHYPAGNTIIDLHTGKILAKPSQKIAGSGRLHGGFIPVSISSGDTSPRKLRYLDRNGNLHTKMPYDNIYEAESEGLTTARINGLLGYIDDQTGKIVIPPRYERAYPFFHQVAIVHKTAEPYECIDRAGRTIVEAPFFDIFSLKEGIAKISLGNKWGFMNYRCQVIAYPNYEKVEPFHEGYAAVKKDGVWGFINTSGEPVITPQYRNAKSFHNGVAAVEIDPLYAASFLLGPYGKN